MNRTTLSEEIVRLIDAEGPMPVERYMALCLGHPTLGYYTTRDPLGIAGDFITAPEISQTFGEMIGVWCAQVWAAMGSPERLMLVEMGPGRGTLMADLVRASRALPAFADALDVHLVETSPALRARQADMLEHLEERVHWHDRLATVPGGDMIVIANEFFDALPVRQYERRNGTWHERVVGLGDDGALTFGLAPDAAPIDVPAQAGEGAVCEASPMRCAVARELGARAGIHRVAGLVIDYGHVRSACGDTLQAVRGHESVPVLDAPGTCDLTAHVDFEALASALAEGGAQVFPVMEQGAYLRAMGIEVRAEVLKRSGDPEAALDVDEAVDRLIHVDRMGAMFKVCAFASPALAPPYPFEA